MPGSRRAAPAPSRCAWSGSAPPRSPWPRFSSGTPRCRASTIPGLASHPQHALARRLMPRLQGGDALVRPARRRARGGALHDAGAAARVRAELRRRGHDVDVSGAHVAPARAPTEEQAAMGIGAGLVRVSVGLEDADDLMADLDRRWARERDGASARLRCPVTLEGRTCGSSPCRSTTRAAARRRAGAARHLRLHAGARHRGGEGTATSTSALAEQAAGGALPFATVDRGAGAWSSARRGSSTSSSGRGRPGNANQRGEERARRGRDRLDLARRRASGPRSTPRRSS